MLMLLVASVSALTVVLFLIGYRQMRTSAMERLEVDDLVLLKGQERRKAEGEGPLSKLAGRFIPTIRKSLSSKQITSLQRRIDEAGRPDGLTVDGFLQRITMWALIISPALLVFLLQGEFLLALLCVVVPVILPLSRLAGAQRRRRESIDKDLPDFLDVLAVTVTAGVGFRASLARVSQRFGGPLSDEVTLTLYQIENGASTRQAFSDLRRRSTSEPIGQFVSALLQSQELGSPLAESLTQIAVDMRRESGQRQRRKAAQVAPRVTLITSLVLLPGALILILVGLYLGTDVDFSAIFGDTP